MLADRAFPELTQNEVDCARPPKVVTRPQANRSPRWPSSR